MPSSLRTFLTSFRNVFWNWLGIWCNTAILKTLSNNLCILSISPTINSSDSEYWIYAYPAAWGSLSTISNADGDWTAAFTTNTVSITGAPGLAMTYNYYITVNKGAFKNKVINFS